MISVLCPSRGRPDSLATSAASLLQLADDPARVEILVAIDPDDTSYEQFAYPSVKVWVAPERYGYSQLHRYANELLKFAAGDWLLNWNDDAVMLTQGWDSIVEAQPPAVLWPGHNHDQYPCNNIFPIWPAAWSRHIGHVSLNTHMDTWWQIIGDQAGGQRHIPVQVRHDRFDLTGLHNDQTYAESHVSAQLADFNSQAMTEAREADADAIRALLGLPAIPRIPE